MNRRPSSTRRADTPGMTSDGADGAGESYADAGPGPKPSGSSSTSARSLRLAGTAIPPAARTGTTPRRPNPPGRWFHTVVAVQTVVLLVAAVGPAADIVVFSLSLWVVLTLVVIWLIRALRYRVTASRGSSARSAWRFAIAPVLALVLAVLLATDVPLRLGWAVSRPSFESAVATELSRPQNADPYGDLTDHTVGLYRVIDTRRIGAHGVAFQVEPGDFNDSGFAYLPDGPDPKQVGPWAEEPQFMSLGDHWYTWYASW